MCGKVFKWIKKMGGLSAMKEHNEAKAKLLYDYLNKSRLFHGTVLRKGRPLMDTRCTVTRIWMQDLSKLRRRQAL